MIVLLGNASSMYPSRIYLLYSNSHALSPTFVDVPPENPSGSARCEIGSLVNRKVAYPSSRLLWIGLENVCNISRRLRDMYLSEAEALSFHRALLSHDPLRPFSSDLQPSDPRRPPRLCPSQVWDHSSTTSRLEHPCGLAHLHCPLNHRVRCRRPLRS